MSGTSGVLNKVFDKVLADLLDRARANGVTDPVQLERIRAELNTWRGQVIAEFERGGSLGATFDRMKNVVSKTALATVMGGPGAGVSALVGAGVAATMQQSVPPPSTIENLAALTGSPLPSGVVAPLAATTPAATAATPADASSPGAAPTASAVRPETFRAWVRRVFNF